MKSENQGQAILSGFKTLPPLLDRIIGRPFTVTVCEEFNYLEAEDQEALNQRMETLKTAKDFYCFRDVFKKNHSLRATYFYSSKEYFISTPSGKINMRDTLFPSDLKSGLEIHNQVKAAMYYCIQNQKLESVVLPGNIFGVPLLSYAFPVFDPEGRVMGAVSFSNDISNLVEIAKKMTRIGQNQDDAVLNQLALLLKDKIEHSRTFAEKLKQESVSSGNLAGMILNNSQEVLKISERLKVLSLNTAIESTKVGEKGNGIGVISRQMKEISEKTGKSVKNIADESKSLFRSSGNLFEMSENLEGIAKKLADESGILLQTSQGMRAQRQELEELVAVSLGEITQNKEDLSKIFQLIQSPRPYF